MFEYKGKQYDKKNFLLINDTLIKHDLGTEPTCIVIQNNLLTIFGGDRKLDIALLKQ